MDFYKCAVVFEMDLDHFWDLSIWEFLKIKEAKIEMNRGLSAMPTDSEAEDIRDFLEEAKKEAQKLKEAAL